MLQQLALEAQHALTSQAQQQPASSALISNFYTQGGDFSSLKRVLALAIAYSRVLDHLTGWKAWGDRHKLIRVTTGVGPPPGLLLVVWNSTLSQPGSAPPPQELSSTSCLTARGRVKCGYSFLFLAGGGGLQSLITTLAAQDVVTWACHKLALSYHRGPYLGCRSGSGR